MNYTGKLLVFQKNNHRRIFGFIL